MSMYYEAMRRRTESVKTVETGFEPSVSAPPPPRTPASAKQTGASTPQRVAAEPRSHKSTVAELPQRAPNKAPPDVGVSERLSIKRVHLNVAQLQRRGLETLDPAWSRNFEAYRRIKRPLLDAAFAGGEARRFANVVAVTSAQSGEGKTHLSLNLAVSVTHEKGTSALLLDADLEYGGLTHALGLERHRGLSDYLSDGALMPHEVILGSREIEKLLMVPAGSKRDDAAELVASKRMQALIASLSTLYPERLIIVDCPPLLADSSAIEIARLCGQLVVVVAEGETRVDDLRELLSRVGDTLKPRFVLNKSFRGDPNQEYSRARR